MMYMHDSNVTVSLLGIHFCRSSVCVCVSEIIQTLTIGTQ